MKVLKINPQPVFSPIEIKIVVETEKEKNEIRLDLNFLIKDVKMGDNSRRLFMGLLEQL